VKQLAHLSAAVVLARRFTGELVPLARGLVWVGASSALAILLELAKPWPVQWIFDAVLVPAAGDGGVPQAPARIAAGTAVALAVALAFAAVQYARSVALAAVGHEFTRGLRTRIFAHLAELSPSFHARHKTGDLLVRLLGDVPLVRTMLIDSGVELATRLALVVGIVAFLFVLDPLLAGAVLIAGPALVLSTRFLTARLTIAVRKQRRKEGELADFVHEAISGSEVIQSLGGSAHVVRRFKRNNRTSVRAGLKATRLAASLAAAVEAQLGLALAIALGFGAWRVTLGTITPGELLVFLSYTRGLLKPVRSAAQHAERIARGTAGAERVLAVLDQAPAVREAIDAVPAPRRPELLRCRGVTFRYPHGPEALRGVDLDLRRGELVALVGHNGAGKSTLAMLVARLEDPSEGTITLDGLPLARYQLTSLRRSVGLVLQQSVLFGESVRENLVLAAPEADDGQLWSALTAADAAELVRELPEGLETVLGSAGKGLSGGQARRLCLARTLLLDPGLLVVDEPFAGLDRVGVERILARLRHLARERIVVVVAHDLADLSSFDRVVWIEQGRIAGQGPHAELEAQVPGYREVLRASGGGRP
jgi:ATP-binding cassette subfamily B protein